MNASVDVLEVMRRHVRRAENSKLTARSMRGADNRLADLREQEAALAAVAELIDAAERAYPPGDYSQDIHGHAMRVAIARCLGGAP